MSSSPVGPEPSISSTSEANSMVPPKKKSKAKARRTALREAQLRGALGQWAMKKGSPGDRIPKKDGNPAAPKSWREVVAEVARLRDAAAELDKEARTNQEGSLATVDAYESSGLPTLDMTDLVKGEIAEEREKYSTEGGQLSMKSYFRGGFWLGANVESQMGRLTVSETTCRPVARLTAMTGRFRDTNGRSSF
jgi:hypothetical protein